MSFENKLNQRLISEASLDDVGAAAAKRGLRKKKPQEFADVRKAMRRPMVQLDTAVHQIDKFLNTTQQDPSRLDSTVAEIEKAFNGLFEPLKAVRAGVQNLRLSANTMKSAGFEYEGQGAKPPQQAQVAKPGVDENQFFNRVATSIQSMNRQEDKMAAAKQGFEAYQQQGGKMNRGEFMRALVQRIRPPALPGAAGSKQYGQQGRRQGELQYHPTRTSQIESSVQRRKMIHENLDAEMPEEIRQFEDLLLKISNRYGISTTEAAKRLMDHGVRSHADWMDAMPPDDPSEQDMSLDQRFSKPQ